MSSRKNVLAPFDIISAGAMTGTSVLTSTVTNIQFLDNICIALNWTGTPVGTFAVEGSLDHEQDMHGNVTVAGNWVALTLPSSPVASGAAGSILIDMNQLSFPYIRVKYTNSSSTGTLTATIGGKQL
jgi:hypothetical protein